MNIIQHKCTDEGEVQFPPVRPLPAITFAFVFNAMALNGRLFPAVLKTCSRCNKAKPEDQFDRNGARLYTHCKSCRLDKAQEARAKMRKKT
jgi:hypothetical protein